MSFTFYDADQVELGFISSLAWIEIRLLVAGGIYPAMETLIEHGMTNRLPELAIECRFLLNKTTDTIVQARLHDLVKMSNKAVEVIILAY